MESKGHATLDGARLLADVGRTFARFALETSPGAIAHVDASTFSGDIHSDFGKVQTKDRGPGSSLDAKVGNGDAQIDMQSFSGSLELRKNN